MAARYYIYRNLHKDCFSVKYKGKVIGHYKNMSATNVSFSVSQKGRDRVLKEQRKNVHAYVVAEAIFPDTYPWDIADITSLERVNYNPYKYSTFVDAWEKPIYNANMVWLAIDILYKRAGITVCK